MENFFRDLFGLHGKTALITGASSGLGEQYAKTLSKAGAQVIVSARTLEKATRVAQTIPNAIPVELDVSRKESVRQALKEIGKSCYTIDICVNNAGIIKPTPVFDDSDDGAFEEVIQTDLTGVWYVTKAVANHMRNSGVHGSIINIAGVRGDAVPSKGGTAYCVAKAAILHMTKTLVGELSPCHIRINCINPGIFPTNLSKNILSRYREEVEKQIPLGFIPNLEDIEGTILYLASDRASGYVTGSVFTIDGGVSWGGGN